MAKARAIYNVRVDVAGGFIALGLDVNLTEMDDHDREFVSGLLMAILDRAREVALKRAKRIQADVLGVTKEQAEKDLGVSLIDGSPAGSGEAVPTVPPASPPGLHIDGCSPNEEGGSVGS